MEDTHEFVQKMHEQKARQEKYSKRKGNSHESRKLPSKQNSQHD